MTLENTISGLRQVNVNAFYDDILRKDVNTLVLYEHHYDAAETLPNRDILVRKVVEKATERGRKTSLLIENLDFPFTEEAKKHPEKYREIMQEESLNDNLNFRGNPDPHYFGRTFVWPLVKLGMENGDVFGINLPRQPRVDLAKDNLVNELLGEIPSSHLRIVLFGYGHFPFLEHKTSHDVEVIQTGRTVKKLNDKWDRDSIDMSQHPLVRAPRGIFKLDNGLYQLNEFL